MRHRTKNVKVPENMVQKVIMSKQMWKDTLEKAKQVWVIAGFAFENIDKIDGTLSTGGQSLHRT